MRPPLLLTSTDNPRLKRLIHLRKQRDRREEGVFVAEGLREVSRALAAGLTLRELFWSPNHAHLTLEDLLHHLPSLPQTDASLYQITSPLVAKISNLDNPEGLFAIFDSPAWRLEDIPTDPAKADLFLIANAINKPGNLGAMARTASAAGATALLTADAVVDPFNPNAIRASTGAVFTLPIISASTPDLLDFLRRRKVRLLAATPDATTPYWDADLTVPIAFVIGAEDTGVTPDWLAAADQQITVPMSQEAVDSLNASNAAAILLFECLRQRRGK